MSTLLLPLLPPLTLLPGAVHAVAVVRRHRQLGPVREADRAVAAVTAHAVVMVSIAVLTALGGILALALDAPAYGLLWATALCLIGCGVGWQIGSTARWHRPAVSSGPGVRLDR